MNDSRIEVRGCTSTEELKQVVNLCDSAFPKTEKEYFDRHVLRDRTLLPEDTRILMKDGTLVSSVQVFPRTMHLGTSRIEFGGIGNVATLPSERGKGYAALVMQDSLNYIRSKDFPLSLLTTTINKYYEKFGFRTIKRQVGQIDLSHIQEYPWIRIFDARTDLEKVMRLYDQYNAGSTGAVVRNRDYWLSQFNFCGEDKGLFLVYEENGDILGFTRAVKKVDRVQVLEYAFADHSEEIVQKLFDHLAFKTSLPKLEFFVSQRERSRLSIMDFQPFKTDTDLMVVFMDASIDLKMQEVLLSENELTYWLSDFF